MLVDWEAVVLDMEQHIQSKNSHGQRELVDLLVALRIRHRQSEGLSERVFRLYPEDLHEVLSRSPAGQGDVEPQAMDIEAHPFEEDSQRIPD